MEVLPHSEPFDESSARFFCGVKPLLRNLRAFDELSARIFLCEVTPALGIPREAILRCHRDESSVACAQSAIPSPASLEKSPAELHDRTLPDTQQQVLQLCDK